ncbi:hypothetical protein INT47_007632 [Mucor saturninus]|uniref:Uncharacterized protein n=1 Tax=Mucor saturninus TaxID=64648 RepID=A0A8H7RAF5_9FUNG|nr:hypothetical protein INT47_007632 [Mucor saturninus]
MPGTTDNNERHNDETPGLLPPHALPCPPPPPPLEQDSSTLTSPWWSEEPPAEQIEGEADHIPSTTDTLPLTEKEPTSSTLNISVLSFNRASAKESPNQWKERCFLLAATDGSLKEHKKETVQKELEEIFDKSKECSMICFLRSSRQMTKDRLLQEHGKLPLTYSFNPFYGTWITIAKTPTRCKEHLLDAGNITKKTFSDYYTMELGDELGHSGEYVTKAVKRTFSPLQHLTQRYMDSWKDGNQQAFFSKFWSSAQKGDAFYLVLDSTKRLIENTLGHDKKPSDKK